MITRLRISFIVFLLVLSAPDASGQEALKANVRNIGFLALTSQWNVRERLPAELGKRGYVEGGNLSIDWRWANGDHGRLARYAEDLVRGNVELIVALSNEAVIEARRAGPRLPIVMLLSNHPVELGLIESLAKPGGNITGTAYIAPETGVKVLELLKDTLPTTRRIAVLLNSAFPGMRFYMAAGEPVARTLDLAPEYFDVASPAEIPAALERIRVMKPDALLVVNTAVVATRVREIAAFAISERLPSVGTARTWVDSGGLFYYGPEVQPIIERTAEVTARVLAGAHPSDIPVSQPLRYEFVINVKTASAIGLTIPNRVLSRADRTIETMPSGGQKP